MVTSLPGRPARGGRAEDLRRHNLATLLGHLHHSGPLTRAELTSRMGLNRSTVGDLVAELAVAGAVRQEAPSAAAGAGRPSPLVVPDPERLLVLAAEVRSTELTVALVGLGGTVLRRGRRRLRGPRPTPDDAMAELAGLARELVAVHPPERVLAMGVSLPGVIRRDDGFVRFAPNLGWLDVALGRPLQALTAVPHVFVGNDGDLGALAEHRRGVAIAHDDLVFLSGDVGIGGGLIVSGRPVRGGGGYAGEVGHVVVRPQGRRCRCGGRGCWETEIGAEAIARALGVQAQGSELVAAVREAVERSPARLAPVAAWLGRGIGALVNVLNPEQVILGGLLRELYPGVRERVLSAVATTALAAGAGQVEITVPVLGADAVLVGAAELAWDAVLTDPAAALEGRPRAAPGMSVRWGTMPP